MDSKTFQKQYPLALIALGIHMEAHDLAAPAAVDTIEYHHFGEDPLTQVIRLRLPAFPDQQDAWIKTVAVDVEYVVEVEYGFRTTWTVRLPETGFRFELVALRPHTLRAVASA